MAFSFRTGFSPRDHAGIPPHSFQGQSNTEPTKKYDFSPTTHVLVFDVNETLLDLSAMDIQFERAFGSPDVRKTWFANLLKSALSMTAKGLYRKFPEIAKAALKLTAIREHKPLSDLECDKILSGLKTLSPYSDVEDGLERLKDAGYRLSVLTNGTEELAKTQIRASGLLSYFEQILSADTVKRLKPAAEPYAMAAERMGVDIDRVLFVGAHAWDIVGASKAGCRTAFIARPGMPPCPPTITPDVVGNNFLEVVDRILAPTKDNPPQAH